MAAVARRPRLGTLHKSSKTNTPVYQSQATRQKAQAPRATLPTRRAQCCENPDIRPGDGEVSCGNCGTILEENAIVSEVTFGETSGGAAMVEGGFISEHQRHANSMGGTMRGLGGMASREQAEMHGRFAIESVGGSLNLPQTIRDQALRWYKLAMNYNFIQGRSMQNVAAVTLYMAARRQPENTLMMMDLAEKVQINVWTLGDTYKKFLKTLGEEDPSLLAGSRMVQEIEPLMLKYCRKLEFEEAAMKVADDACKILKRMSRDWMVQGRQPAGVCGACIVLAARMNNFRRTVREVVYVVKVADTTIHHRLFEYKNTPSSQLTVQQFREIGNRLKVTTLPPSIWRRELREERKEKRKAGFNEENSAAVVEISDGSDTEAGPNNAPTRPARASKMRKKNTGVSQEGATPAAGANSEALDGNNEDYLEDVADAALDEAVDDDAFVLPKKRGRKKKREPIVIPDEDLEVEGMIEAELAATIKDWEQIFKECAKNENHPVLKNAGWSAQQMLRAQLDQRDVPEVSNSPDIGVDEFDDDPDVANCILGPDEVRRKEQIWITENEEWLRAQQEKMLKAELEAAEDKPKKPKQKRKHHQMGDGSVLEGQPAASAADAAQKMLKKRSNGFSNHINYDRLKELFGGQAASSPSDIGSRQDASPAGTNPAMQTPPVIQITDEDAEGEYEDDYEPQQQFAEEEEEDLEHQYMDDPDEGFEDYTENY
jgi:transcription factor IIIB subunit 2